jgi:hypothetical protein
MESISKSQTPVTITGSTRRNNRVVFMNYNKQNTPRRKNSNDKAYEDNWEKIFGKKDEKTTLENSLPKKELIENVGRPIINYQAICVPSTFVENKDDSNI